MSRTRIGDDQAVQSVDLTSEVTGTLPVANGGTGNATNTLNSLLVGNGTGAVGGIAPGSSTNVLTSNGTSWTSSPIPTLNQNTTGTAAVATKWVPRVGSTASSGTPSIDMALYEQYDITALAAAITSVTISNGADGLKLVIRIKDNGTARALTFGSQFRALGVTLPTTTVVSKTLYLGGIWNSADSVLDIVALAQQA